MLLHAEEKEWENHILEVQSELKEAKEALEEYENIGRAQLRD